MPDPINIEAELTAIHDRNRKVEADKAWETSWTRRLVIAGMTYVVALVAQRVHSHGWLCAFDALPAGCEGVVGEKALTKTHYFVSVIAL